MAAQIGSLFVSLTADIKPFATEMNRAAGVSQRTADSIRKSVGATEESLKRLRGGVGSRSTFSPGRILAASRAFDSLNSRTDLLRAALLTTTAAFGGLAAAMTSNVLLRYADTATKLSNQLRVVSKDSIELVAQQRAIATAANNARASLSASATLYARIRKSAPERSADAAVKMTETIQKALTLGGASAQEAASAMLQLSQGLASNRLGGEELRAVLETPLGLELAKGLGVTIAKFREMGHAGELTADVILNALEKIAPEIDKQFTQSVRTLDQALTVADNNITLYIGSVNEAYGITTKLGDGIVWLSEHLDELGAIAALTGISIGTVFAGRLGARGIGALSGAVGARVAMFKELKKESHDAFQAASADMDGFRRKLRELELERTQTAIKSIYPDESAPPSFLKDYQRAVEQLNRAEQEREKSVANLTNLQRKLGSVQAAVSTKAVALADKQAAAEERLYRAKKRMDDIQDRLIFAKNARTLIPEFGDFTDDEKKYREQNNRRLISTLGKESRAVSAEIEREQAAIQAAADQIARIQVDADRRAADERIKIQRQVTAAAIELEERKAQVIEARQRTLDARSNADLAGASAAAREVAELDKQIAILGRTIGEGESHIAKLQAATTRSAQALSFLRNQGAAILGLFGGPWGLALTAAIAGLGYFAARSAEADAASERFSNKLRQMGLIAEETEGKIKSLADAQIEAARAEKREAEEQFEDRRKKLLYLGSKANFLGEGFLFDDQEIKAVGEQIANLAFDLEAGKINAEDALDALKRLTTENYGGAVDEISLELQNLIKELIAAPEYMKAVENRLQAISDVATAGPLIASPGASIAKAREQIAALTKFTDSYREAMARTSREQKVFTAAQQLMKDAIDANIPLTERQARALAEEGIAAQEAARKYEELTAAMEAAIKVGLSYEEASATAPDFGMRTAAETAQRQLGEVNRLMQMFAGQAGSSVSDLTGQAADRPFRDLETTAFLERRRKEITQSEDAARRMAIAEEEMADALALGITLTPQAAEGLADLRLKTEQQEEAARAAADAIREFNTELTAMIGSGRSYDQAISIVPSFNDPTEEAARKRFLEDLAMLNQLRRAAPDQSLVDAASSNPYGDLAGKAYLDELVRNASKTREQLDLDATAQDIYNDSISRGTPVTLEQARATAALVVEREKLSRTVDSRKNVLQDAARTTEQLRLEREALAQTTVEADAARRAFDMLSAAQDENGRVTEDLRNKILGIAAAQAAYAYQTEQLRKAKEFERSSRDTMEQLQMERAALSMTAVEAVALRRAFEMLNQAKDENGYVSDEMRQKIIAAAAEQAVFATETERLKAEQEELAQSASDAFDALAKSIGDAVANGGDLKDVLRQLIPLALDLFAKFVGPKLDMWLNGKPSRGSYTTPQTASSVQSMISSRVPASTAASAAAAATTSSLLGVPAVRPGTAAAGSGAFRIARGNPNIDPRLMDILRTTAERGGWRADFISGHDARPGGRGFHPKGKAADIQLYDAAGNPLKNYQNAADFRQYELFAQEARMVQMEKYPELNSQFRWGGYFSGPKGKYGALDSMHFDLGSTGAMAGGSWESGLTQRQRGLYPGVTSYGMGATTGEATAALTSLAESAKTADVGLGSLGKSVDDVVTSLGMGGGTEGTAAGPMDLGAMLKGGTSGTGAGLVASISQGLQESLAGFFTEGGFTSMLTGLFSRLFSGFMAEGGTIGMGRFAVVGERGPELIAAGRKSLGVYPLTSGQIAGGRMGNEVRQGGILDGRSFSYRSGDIIVHGNVDQSVLPQVEAMVNERSARDRREIQRGIGPMSARYQKLKG
jgi:tape measure domain-containing protein